MTQNQDSTHTDDMAAQALHNLSQGLPVTQRVAIAFAHPDDEAIGAGGSLGLFPSLVLIQATDGVPPDPIHSHRRGFATREAYAQGRREEMGRALSASGQPGACLVELGYGDQTTTANMASLALDIVDVLRREDIRILITHPYEGGHPDHDSVAMACHAAVALLAREGVEVALLEMASYHASSRGGYLRAGRFLWSDDTSPPEAVVPLGQAQRSSKQAMVSSHASQWRTLFALMTGPLLIEERFRRAPPCDFSRPPRGMGEFLHYETRSADWGMTGDVWRARAVSALAELQLASPPSSGSASG